MRRIVVALVDILCVPVGWAIDRAARRLNDVEDD
jgi:hypothetical protein